MALKIPEFQREPGAAARGLFFHVGPRRARRRYRWDPYVQGKVLKPSMLHVLRTSYAILRNKPAGAASMVHSAESLASLSMLRYEKDTAPPQVRLRGDDLNYQERDEQKGTAKARPNLPFREAK